ncbi:MAG: hypothetical protein IPG07_02075 [Crocinitomicaceae bacterium]|nr:hypothetical protein [Crocinitomicaceae bacterium]
MFCWFLAQQYLVVGFYLVYGSVLIDLFVVFFNIVASLLFVPHIFAHYYNYFFQASYSIH